MDVVGTISYIGQQINFLDQERFAFLAGNGIAFYDTTKGPRDILWNFAGEDKPDSIGIKTFGVNWERQLMAVARKGGLLEILSLSPNDNSASVDSSLFCQMSTAAISTDDDVAVDIEHVSFSLDGTRIYVLTGMMNRQLLIWRVPDSTGGTPVLILNYKLSSSFDVCVPNPCNSDYFYLQSTTDKSVAVGFVNEILKTFSVKLSSVAINVPIDVPENETPEDFSTVTDVEFALWLPGFSLLLGTTTGFINLSNCEKGVLEYNNLGRFNTQEKGYPAKDIIPAAAVLSINHIIVAADGLVYWFPFSNNVTTVNGEKKKTIVIDLSKPQQIVSTKTQERDTVIRSMTVNNDYSTLLVGVNSGEIFKVPVEIVEVAQLDDNDRQGDSDKKKPELDILSPERVVSETKRGVILCNTNFIMNVKKMSVRSMSTLSLFVTATHQGHINFWRYGQTNIEPMVINGGVRRSTPRPLTLTHGIYANIKAAITSLSVVPIDFKANANLICVGFDNGKFLIWFIEANECEDEEAKDNEFGSAMEDDEGSCLVKLNIRKVYEFQLFDAPISILTPIISQGKESAHVRMAVASFDRKEIIILEMMKDTEFLFKPSPNFMVLEDGEGPEAINLVHDTLFVWCRSGSLFTFSVITAEVNYYREKLDVKLPLIYSAAYCPALSEKIKAFVILTGTKVMSLCLMEMAVKRANSGGDCRATYQNFVHSDIVLKVAYSPNGSYIATACLDGSLYIWKVDEENGTIYMLNRVRLHSKAVTSITFSYCSSLIMTNAVDGSCFVLALEKAKGATQKVSTFLSKGIEYDVEFSTEHEELAAENPGMTWIDISAKEKLKDLQASFKFKVMSINSAMSEIGNRLKKLLDQNQMRTDLEQLERGAFVVDEQRRDEILDANVVNAEAERNLHRQKDLLEELCASRVRSKCWDTSKTRSYSILPFSASGVDNIPKVNHDAVSSFSVRRYDAVHQDQLSKVTRLRGMEVRAQHLSPLGDVTKVPNSSNYRCAWKAAVAGCPGSISWVANEGVKWPVYGSIEKFLVDEQLEAEKAKDVKGKDGKDKDAKDGSVDEDDYNADPDEEVVELEENDILNLLYPPQSVRTPVQKRNQIILLTEVINQLRNKFNAKFDKVRQEKDEIVAGIESRNARIMTIFEDLQISEVLQTPKFHDVEQPGSAITISKAEIKSKPYESEAARMQRLKEEEERKRKEMESDKEDIKGRALDEMMHGTLEIKRNALTDQAQIYKPEWMDTLAVTEMNPEQLKEFDAYTQKVKEVQEEQVAYRKSLEQEIKKLKHEIVDVCRTFDDKLEEVANLKIFVSQEIIATEMYISRIALNMARSEQALFKLKSIESKIVTLRKDRNDLRSKIDTHNESFDDLKSKVNNVQEDIRNMDKSFKRDLQSLCGTTFDQDSLKIFTQLYRSRVYPAGAFELENEDSRADISSSNVRGGGSRGSGKAASKTSSARGGSKSSRAAQKKVPMGKSQKQSSVNKDSSKVKSSAQAGTASGYDPSPLGPMQLAAQALEASDPNTNLQNENNPYYETLLLMEAEKKMKENYIPILNSLSMELDCPDGFVVDQFSWHKLQELRTARIEKEIEDKLLSIQYLDLKGKLESLDQEETVLVSSINDMKNDRDDTFAFLQNLDADLDVVVCLRQGQDEVDKDAATTNYSESLLIPVDVVGKYNKKIKDLGKEKISTLSKIKQFRRKINMIDWEANHNLLEAKHYESYLTDLQLFRVTRELQKVIRDGSDASRAKEKVDKVASRKDFLIKDYEMKIQTLGKNNENLLRTIDERKQECLMLQDKVSLLKSEVQSCKGVKLSRDEARGVQGDPINVAASKMKKVVGRRHMVDIARAQAEEIDYLRQELDKMHQRTFPSFVKATRKRLAVNVDI